MELEHFKQQRELAKIAIERSRQDRKEKCLNIVTNLFCEPRVQHFEEYLQVEATSEEEAHDKFRDAIDSGTVLGHQLS